MNLIPLEKFQPTHLDKSVNIEINRCVNLVKWIFNEISSIFILSLPKFILSLLWYLGMKINTKKFLRLIDDSFINVDEGD